MYCVDVMKQYVYKVGLYECPVVVGFFFYRDKNECSQHLRQEGNEMCSLETINLVQDYHKNTQNSTGYLKGQLLVDDLKFYCKPKLSLT